MRIGDVLFFSPRYKFAELNFDDTHSLIEAFQDRVYGFYLGPAERCIDAGEAFAGGLICCAAIEFIARAFGCEHGSEWLLARLPDFGHDEKLTRRFWTLFRDGLAHEGRVKSFGGGSGQFSLELPETVTNLDSVVIVNPQLLLKAVMVAFKKSCEEIDGNRAAQLATFLRGYFEAEVIAAKR
jgi:hypothetical protein